MSNSPPVDLARLGLQRGVLYEVLATTRFPGTRVANVAPMGCVVTGQAEVTFYPFRDTDTFGNVVAAGRVNLNFHDDVALFARAAFRGWHRGLEEREVPGDAIAWTTDETEPVLRAAPLVLTCALAEKPAESARATCRLRVTNVITPGGSVEADSRLEGAERGKTTANECLLPHLGFFVRARHLALEAIIHATRVRLHADRGDATAVDKYLDLVDFYCTEALKYRPPPDVERAVALTRAYCRAEAAKSDSAP